MVIFYFFEILNGLLIMLSERQCFYIFRTLPPAIYAISYEISIDINDSALSAQKIG